ncbi:hypothetical protein [Aerococcus urinaeequi]|uniref:hypothetical protein n=1 Tax=Aerococcus urinaeequi TaxID=51665 RepID=UPI003B3B0634
MANFSGFTFDGKHSYRDMRMTIDPERNISIPNKIKYKESLPFSNKVWDFSSIYGGPIYEERTLTYKFNLMGKSIESKADMNMIKTVLLKWLLSPNEKTPLYDDHFPNFYFMAEVEGNNSFEEDWKHGFLNVTFTAQPFMIDIMPEGHDIWDLFNFDLDVSQPTKFTFKSYWSNFKQLNIGDQATYGAWATVYQTDTGTGTKINPGFHGYTYKIVDKKTVSQSRSQIAYKLDNHNEWLLEQDIVQAQSEYLDVVVINPSISDVAPIITTNSSVTIVRDGEIYNLQPGVYETEQFVLKSGENHMQMYIPDITLNIDFNFHKELI